MFGKKEKKNSIKNVATLDLRPYVDGGALSEINSIENVAVLILPKEMDEKSSAEFAKIKLVNVASMVNLDKGSTIHQINGSGTSEKLNDSGLYLINGTQIIHDLNSEADIRFMINGTVIFDKSCKDKVNILSCNGTYLFTDLSGDVKCYSNKTTIDAQTLQYIEEKSIIVAGNKIIIEEDVTSDMLAQKQIQLIAGNKVVAGDNSMAYVRAKAVVGNKVQSLKEYNKMR